MKHLHVSILTNNSVSLRKSEVEESLRTGELIRVTHNKQTMDITRNMLPHFNSSYGDGDDMFLNYPFTPSAYE